MLEWMALRSHRCPKSDPSTPYCTLSGCAYGGCPLASRRLVGFRKNARPARFQRYRSRRCYVAPWKFEICLRKCIGEVSEDFWTLFHQQTEGGLCRALELRGGNHSYFGMLPGTPRTTQIARFVQTLASTLTGFTPHIKPILRASKGFRRVLKVFPKFDLRIRNLSLPFLAFGRSKGVFGANLALSVGGTSLDSPALGGGSA